MADSSFKVRLSKKFTEILETVKKDGKVPQDLWDSFYKDAIELILEDMSTEDYTYEMKQVLAEELLSDLLTSLLVHKKDSLQYDDCFPFAVYLERAVRSYCAQLGRDRKAAKKARVGGENNEYDQGPIEEVLNSESPSPEDSLVQREKPPATVMKVKGRRVTVKEVMELLHLIFEKDEIERYLPALLVISANVGVTTMTSKYRCMWPTPMRAMACCLHSLTNSKNVNVPTLAIEHLVKGIGVLIDTKFSKDRDAFLRTICALDGSSVARLATFFTNPQGCVRVTASSTFGSGRGGEVSPTVVKILCSLMAGLSKAIQDVNVFNEKGQTLEALSRLEDLTKSLSKIVKDLERTASRYTVKVKKRKEDE